ncbi:MAG: pyridoxal phosphate-dependent aminotransferase [Acidimicrobiales bacterium]|nr:pyridoxal phosphate-dependent aminotransferase [Acidimicrobiales bacterium]MDP6297887.1 pyridoxal phosphate-dependent aminotransferase [Acidimicrobiales bacterium]HJM28513.1 pyridoxal phosphate-dependent aminotransferase [Acidimicrobiales bacterium]HJM98316.1 pyridoxal phosphate-dependent aminotransferase [Acidimicrobiales bacterium]
MSEESRISKRVGAIAPSATLAVTSKAKELKAAGAPVIGFGAGEPDFLTPPHIVEAAINACSEPQNHRYSPAGGLPELKEAIAEKTFRDSGVQISPEQVVITNGGKHAVYNCMQVLLDAGDEVLLPSPFWTTYPEPVALAGATTTILPTSEETGFRVSVEQLNASLTERTKALVFCSPSNPTGAVYPREEIEAIGQWAIENNVWIITDEIYEHLIYGTNTHHSLPQLVPQCSEKTVILNGVAKTYAMTGWRVGWIIAPKDVAKASATLQSHQTSNVANVSQRAALAAVSGPLDAVEEMREAFDRRRQLMYSMLTEIDGVSLMEPQGAFYAFPNFKEIIGSEIAGRTVHNTADLAQIFLEEIHVALVPGEAFGAPGYARLSFALSDEDLIEGVERIANLLRR